MSLKILHISPERHFVTGQAGFFEVSGVAQWNGTDLTGSLAVPFKHVSEVLLTPASNKTDSFTNQSIQITLGTVSATTVFIIQSPAAGSLGLTVVNSSTLVNNDTANWSFGAVDKASTLTLVDSTAAINSNKATGGQTISAYTGVILTGNGTNNSVSRGDMIEVTLTKGGTAANLTETTLIANFLTARSDETLTVAELQNMDTAGIIAVSGGNLTINRNTNNPESSSCFSFVIRGTDA